VAVTTTTEAAAAERAGWLPRATQSARTTFGPLRIRNYRLYIGGQTLSQMGSWVQIVAQSWLVLKLTGSGTALGLVTAFQFLPVLLLGAYGGVLADRANKRWLLLSTQLFDGALATTLGILCVSGAVKLWMVYVLAMGLGLVSAVEQPTGSSFIMEMTGPEHVSKAVTLATVLMNGSRIVGPAVGALLIVWVGIGQCFIVNGISYLAVVAALLLMRGADLEPHVPATRQKGQQREGFRYVRRTPELLGPLLVLAVVGTLAFEFKVTLPLAADHTFHKGAGAYGTLSSAMGAGAVIGGLIGAARFRATSRGVAGASVFFGASIVAAAMMPTYPLMVLLMLPVGAGSVAFLSCTNAALQLSARPDMRGRVMSLWTMAILGSASVGGPIIGYIGQHFGARLALATGGTATAVAGIVLLRVMGRSHDPNPTLEFVTTEAAA
jgi:MFS family permease